MLDGDIFFAEKKTPLGMYFTCDIKKSSDKAYQIFLKKKHLFDATERTVTLGLEEQYSQGLIERERNYLLSPGL